MIWQNFFRTFELSIGSEKLKASLYEKWEPQGNYIDE